MLTGRPKPSLELTGGERTQLKSLAASRSLPHALVCRAKIVLWSAEGQSNTEIAERLGWAKVTVGKWRQRFLQQRVAGLYDELRRGGHAVLPMSRLLFCSSVPSPASRPGPPLGAFAKPLTTAVFLNPPCIGCFRRLRYSRTEAVALNSRLTPSSSRRRGTSLAFT